MSHADYLAMRWLQDEFLPERYLAAPDGRPLHAYRCTDDELIALSQRLGEALATDAPVKRHLAALFCLFAAEWWRRRYDGSAWGWEPVFQELGARYDRDQMGAWQRASTLTDKGLTYWRRDLRRSAHRREFLLSLVLEGGLPLGLLVAGKGRLTDHLRRVLAELNRFGPNGELARHLSEQHAHLLPASFCRPEVHALIGDLLAAVLRWRDGIPVSVAPGDAMAWLDANAPDWRRDLPLPVDDDAARGLLAGLIRDTVALRGRGPGLTTLVSRLLVSDGTTWRPVLTFTMDGSVSLDGPVPLAAIPGAATRARLRAAGDLEGLAPGPLALLQAEGTERNVWRMEALSAGKITVQWPLDAPVDLSLRVDGATVQTFGARGGEPAAQPPLVFDALDDDPEPTRLRLLGSGSTRTRKDRLYIACRNGADLLPDEGATVRSLGPIGGTDLTIHEIAGTVRWRDGDEGLSLLFRTRSEDEARSRLTVDGRPPSWDVDAPLAVLGRPVLWEATGGMIARRVRPGDLRWRPAGGGPWRSLPRDGSWPFGLIDLVLVREEEVLDRLRLAVLPESARVRREADGPRKGLLRLDGCDGADLRIDRNVLGADVTHAVERHEGGGVVRLEAAGVPPSRVPVVVSWPGQGEVCCLLPFPVRGGGFIDPQGRWLPRNARLHLDQLYGIRALRDPGSGDAEVFGWVKAPDLTGDRQSWIRHRFDGVCALASLRAPLLNLLSASQELDTVVELVVRCGGSDSPPVRVSRVDLELDIEGERVGLKPASLAALSQSNLASAELVCRPIADLAAPEETLPTVPEAEGPPAWMFHKEGRAPGSWLIYGRVGGRHRFRPRAVSIAGDAAPDRVAGLAAISRIADHCERQRALHTLLDSMADDPLHGAWGEVDQSLRAIQGHLPLATLNLFQRLPERPDALTMLLARAPISMVGRILAMQDELPFLWTVLPFRSWLRAFTAAERGLVGLIVGGGQTEDAARVFAADVIDRILVQVEEEQTALSCTTALLREHLGRPRSGDCTLVHLRQAPFRQLLAGKLAALRMAVRRRNDGPQWPTCTEFPEVVSGLPPEHLDLPRPLRPVLDAPFAAARLATTGERADDRMLRALRQCRAFDTEWFDEAYVFALGLALSEPDVITCWSA